MQNRTTKIIISIVAAAMIMTLITGCKNNRGGDNNEWKEIKVTEVPHADSFDNFLFCTEVFYDRDVAFDAAAEADPKTAEYILRQALMWVESFRRPADGDPEKDADFFDESTVSYESTSEKKDPKEWFTNNSEYSSVDVNDANWVLNNIFGLDDSYISAALEEAEKNHTVYIDGGRYYYTEEAEDMNIENQVTEVVSVKEKGQTYYVEYLTADAENNEYTDEDMTRIDKNKPYETYYEILELKTINDRPYWTVRYNGKEEPALETK